MQIQSSPLPQLPPGVGIGALPPGVSGNAPPAPQGLQNAKVVLPTPSLLLEALPTAFASSAPSLTSMGLQAVAPQPPVASGDDFALMPETFVSLEKPTSAPAVSAPKMQRMTSEQVLSHLKQIHGLEARPNAGVIERATVFLKNLLPNSKVKQLQADIKQLAGSFQQAQAALPARRELAINNAIVQKLSASATLEDAHAALTEALNTSAHQRNPVGAFAAQLVLTEHDDWDSKFLQVLQDCNPKLAKELATSEAQAGFRESLAASLPTSMGKDEKGDQVLNFKGDKFEMTQKLGTGGFGVAWLFKSPSSGAELVVKIPKDNVSITDVAEEYGLHRALAATGEHPNLLGLRGLVTALPNDTNNEGDTKVFIITDVASNGSLNAVSHRIGGTEQLDNIDKNFLVKKLVFDIMQGAAQMHKSGFAHFDIKPDNVLVHEGTALLADFGLSQTKAQMETGDVGRRGTATHIAPEIYGTVKHHHTEKADVWSLGTMAYELLNSFGKSLPNTLNTPVAAPPTEASSVDAPPAAQSFVAIEALRGQAMPSNAARVGINDQFSFGNVVSLDTPAIANAQTPLERLVNRMLATNPADRPSMDEVLKDPVFQVLKGTDGKISKSATAEAARLFDIVFKQQPAEASAATGVAS